MCLVIQEYRGRGSGRCERGSPWCSAETAAFTCSHPFLALLTRTLLYPLHHDHLHRHTPVNCWSEGQLSP